VGKGEKHLAVEVEDHPIEYETFEGVIPKGQYGGGTVMVWDRGTYYVYGEDPLQALKDGRMHIVLHGEKAHGEWALIRTRMDADKPQWLLLKATESLPQISKKLDDQSVKTGRAMQQIAEERDAEWQSNRGEAAEERERRSAAKTKKTAPAKSAARRTKSAAAKSDLAAELKELPAGKPLFVPPMKPKLLEEAPTAGDWVYELKFDGFRIVAVKNGEKVNLVSRNGNELAARFPRGCRCCSRAAGERLRHRRRSGRAG
jgi:bifunctional non-homologous end joining protein LigD